MMTVGLCKSTAGAGFTATGPTSNTGNLQTAVRRFKYQ